MVNGNNALGLVYVILALVVLGPVLYNYYTTAHSIQTTEWRRSTCQVGANRITKEKKVRSCSEGHCDYYHCYTPEVEVKLQGASDKVWAKEFHEHSDEDCWLYKPLAERWLVSKRYDKGGERTCFYDVSDRSHVKFSPTRAPIHWWTWLWYIWQGGLGLLMLYVGIVFLIDWLPGLWCQCCCARDRDRETDAESTPLIAEELPRCHQRTWDVSIALWRLAWLALALGVAFFGPSTWQGSHPGITGTHNDFDRTWAKWANGDQKFLDHMVNHCDVLYRWMAIGICLAEGLSLLNCGIRYYVKNKILEQDQGQPVPAMGWLTLLDIWPDITGDAQGLSCSIYFVFIFHVKFFRS